MNSEKLYCSWHLTLYTSDLVHKYFSLLPSFPLFSICTFENKFFQAYPIQIFISPVTNALPFQKVKENDMKKLFNKYPAGGEHHSHTCNDIDKHANS